MKCKSDLRACAKRVEQVIAAQRIANVSLELKRAGKWDTGSNARLGPAQMLSVSPIASPAVMFALNDPRSGLSSPSIRYHEALPPREAERVRRDERAHSGARVRSIMAAVSTVRFTLLQVHP